MHKIIYFLFFISLTTFSQENIKVKDYLKINDIGIKIIDKKKLKKDISDLSLEKDAEKTLKKRLKLEEKEIKKEIKSYNKSVYEKRRKEEYLIRSGMQKSTEIPVVDSVDTEKEIIVIPEKLHAKKVDKVFDENFVEEDTLEIVVKEKSQIIPPKREFYPWTHKLKNKCNWKILKVDYIEQDTIYTTDKYTVYSNLKDKNEIFGEVNMRLLIEDNLVFLELDFSLKNLKVNQVLTSNSKDKLVILGKKKELVELPFFGIKQTAIVNFSKSDQLIKARYLINDTNLQVLKDIKWNTLKVNFGSETMLFPLSKNFTSKAPKSEVKKVFNSYLNCL